MKSKFNFRKKHFLFLFCFIVAVLWTTKRINPSLALPNGWGATRQEARPAMLQDSVAVHAKLVDSILQRPRTFVKFTDEAGRPLAHKVTSVSDFKIAFPDMNDVQLATATCLGVPSAADREEAEKMKKSLVYIGNNPHYYVKTLHNSIPYLVPRAALLLDEIGRAFLDSLTVKGYPFHKIVVTSVLRSRKDIERLQWFNKNASTQSCHQFGTTFDIGYNKFVRIQTPGEPEKPNSNPVLLKSILAEVLNDMRQQGLCYVKHEQRQSCFHITAR